MPLRQVCLAGLKIVSVSLTECTYVELDSILNEFASLVCAVVSPPATRQAPQPASGDQFDDYLTDSSDGDIRQSQSSAQLAPHNPTLISQLHTHNNPPLVQTLREPTLCLPRAVAGAYAVVVRTGRDIASSRGPLPNGRRLRPLRTTRSPVFSSFLDQCEARGIL